MSEVKARPDTFPALRRHQSGEIRGIPTEVSLTSFSDKVLVTISQEGRLSQWIQVALSGSPAGAVEMALPSSNNGLLPSTHMTPITILGGGGGERETLGQLYAAQIASQLSLRNPEDRRILILGLGLRSSNTDREDFFDLLDLARSII